MVGDERVSDGDMSESEEYRTNECITHQTQHLPTTALPARNEAVAI